MKWYRWLFSLVLLFTLLNSSLGIAHAEDPIPGINPQLPRPPEGTTLAEGDSAVTTTTTLNLPALKAVLIVGNIDGDYGTWPLSEFNNIKLA